tara:strand:- start:197 stop:877 length:681 start_codon:yes stop_codon:yes gene_type:complete
MKKQVKELWIWPPGASGNFLMMNHYGTGRAKPNNEFEVRGPVKWIPMFFNKIHAYHYLKIGHTINQQKYEENLKRLLESPEENLAWHWVPIYLKEHLDIDSIHYILPKPDIQWYISFLTLVKNRTTSTYDNFISDLLSQTKIENLEVEYKERLQEVNSIKANKTNIIDYQSMFLDYDDKLLEQYNLKKDVVKTYTEDNISLIENFIKVNLSKKEQDVFLPKLGALV